MATEPQGFVIYNRQNHDVPLSARQKWANDLEYMKRNAESCGMSVTLKFSKFNNTTMSYLSISERGHDE